MMQSRKGFSLIEIVVAMTILSVVLLSVAKATTALAMRGHGTDLVAKRNAALQLEENKFEATPFDSLAKFSTSDTTITWRLSNDTTFSYKRRRKITSVTSTRDSIIIVVVPTADTTKKDSVVFIRAKPANYLCKTCA